MKNFDSSNTWYNGNIVTQFYHTAKYIRMDNGDCYAYEANSDRFSITDIVIKVKTELDSDEKIKKESKRKHDDQVNKIYKKI